MQDHFLLGEVARVLGRKPHHVTHALVSGQVQEPAMRIANKRLFTRDDVGRLARHFKTTPNWDALDPVPSNDQHQAMERLTLRPPFEVAEVSATGHEVRDGDGEVFCWAPDRGRALILAGLLEACRG